MEEKYLEDGQTVEVIQQLNDGRYLVSNIYFDSNDEWASRTDEYIAGKVFDAPPLHKYDKTIKALQEEIDKLREARRALANEVAAQEKIMADRRKRYARHKALCHIDDFLDNKITHFAFLHEWRCPSIETFEEALNSERERRFSPDNMKLLCLFGRSNGDLEWKLNQYYDGSGSWNVTIPCTSLQEATETVKNFIFEEIAKTTGKPLSRVVEMANHFCVPLPEGYERSVKETAKEAILKDIDKATAELEEKQKKLAAIG